MNLKDLETGARQILSDVQQQKLFSGTPEEASYAFLYAVEAGDEQSAHILFPYAAHQGCRRNGLTEAFDQKNNNLIDLLWGVCDNTLYNFSNFGRAIKAERWDLLEDFF